MIMMTVASETKACLVRLLERRSLSKFSCRMSLHRICCMGSIVLDVPFTSWLYPCHSIVLFRFLLKTLLVCLKVRLLTCRKKFTYEEFGEVEQLAARSTSLIVSSVHLCLIVQLTSACGKQRLI